MLKSFTDIVNSMKAYIQAKNPSIDVSEGSITNDVIISAPSNEVAEFYVDNQTTSESQSLETAIDSAVDIHAGNLSLVRKSATTAVGVITFFARTQPISDIVIPAGTLVSTLPSAGNNSLQFTTTLPVTMYAALALSYLNTGNALYEITAPIEALTAGVTGVTGPQTIVSLNTNVVGLNGCYNTQATTGAEDVEASADLKLRVAAKWRGNSLGTADGYLSEATVYPGVLDALVIGGNATGRDDLGALDIFIRGSVITPASDLFESAVNYPPLVLSQQPVANPTTLAIITANGGVLSPSSYTFVKDTGAFAGSVRGQDKIQWNSVLPASSGSVTVLYSYNGLPQEMQNYFSDSLRAVQNVSLLIKEATEVLIDLAFNIKIKPGFGPSTVISDLTTLLAEYFNALGLGAYILQSDVAEVILGYPGVNDVQLPFTTFASHDGSIIPDTFHNLQLLSSSYPILNLLTITPVS